MMLLLLPVAMEEERGGARRGIAGCHRRRGTRRRTVARVSCISIRWELGNGGLEVVSAVPAAVVGRRSSGGTN